MITTKPLKTSPSLSLLAIKQEPPKPTMILPWKMKRKPHVAEAVTTHRRRPPRASSELWLTHQPRTKTVGENSHHVAVEGERITPACYNASSPTEAPLFSLSLYLPGLALCPEETVTRRLRTS